MIHDSRMGIAYDTIYYGVLFFNFEAMKKEYQSSYGIGEEDYQYFYQLRKVTPKPAPELYPLFYYDLVNPCVLSDYFYNNYFFGQEEFMTFLDRIRKNPENFLCAILLYYLDEQVEVKKSNSLELIQKILKLDIDIVLRAQIVNLIVNYEEVLKELISFLENSYNAVEELHIQEQGVIKNTSKIFNTEHFLQHLNEVSAINCEHTSKKDKMSVSLLNVLIILQKGTEDLGYKYIFGRRCYEFLDFYYSYYKIPPELLCQALGNPVKASILYCLEEEEHTVSQLAEILPSSRQNLNRHVLWLLDYMLITVSHVNGLEIYYKINKDFFHSAKNTLFQYVAAFETGSHKKLGVENNEKMDETND